MAAIVLISCAHKQRPGTHPARYLYISPLFTKCLDYAEKIVKADRIYVLSTKHHLIGLDEQIEKYNVPEPVEGWHAWGKRVKEQLRQVCSLEEDHFVLLPAARYISYIKNYIKHKETPLEGLRIGERLAWLSQYV